MSRAVLPIVSVDDGTELGQLLLRPDGTVEADETGESIHAQIMREFELGSAEAFAKLDREGWTNAYVMIKPE